MRLLDIKGAIKSKSVLGVTHDLALATDCGYDRVLNQVKLTDYSVNGNRHRR